MSDPRISFLTARCSSAEVPADLLAVLDDNPIAPARREALHATLKAARRRDRALRRVEYLACTKSPCAPPSIGPPSPLYLWRMKAPWEQDMNTKRIGRFRHA